MLRPRDALDQRVHEASLEISPEPKNLLFVHEAFGNHLGIARFSGRSRELSLESTVCFEHSPRTSPAFISRIARGPFRSPTLPARCQTSLAKSIATNMIPQTITAAGFADSFLRRFYGDYRATHRTHSRHQSWHSLPAARSKWNPGALVNALARPRQLPTQDCGDTISRSAVSGMNKKKTVNATAAAAPNDRNVGEYPK